MQSALLKNLVTSKDTNNLESQLASKFQSENIFKGAGFDFNILFNSLLSNVTTDKSEQIDFSIIYQIKKLQN
ncbi:MAG: hypothetical protein HXX81_03175 [Campylobacterales bacterium]|nr:hypothetical protein [Campylobacterales bacterium]